MIDFLQSNEFEAVSPSIYKKFALMGENMWLIFIQERNINEH